MKNLAGRCSDGVAKCGLLFLSCSFGALLSVNALTQYYFIPNDRNDYSQPENYAMDAALTQKSTVLPAVGDQVYVKGSVTIDMTDTATVSVISRLRNMRPYSASSILYIDVPTGEERTLPTAYCREASEWVSETQNWPAGRFVKTGGGILNLTATNQTAYYCRHFEVREGTVRLPTVVTGQYSSYLPLGIVTLAEGATLVAGRQHAISLSADPTPVSHYLYALQGAGTFLQEDKGTALFILGGTAYDLTTDRYVFSGSISPRFSLRIAGGLQQFDLTDGLFSGTEISGHDVISGQEYTNATFAVAKIGNPGEPSSIGSNAVVNAGRNKTNKQVGGAGGLRYLGTGEKTTKKFEIAYAQHSPLTLDGGPHGGLELAGAFVVDAWRPGWDRVLFTGENTNACVWSAGTKDGVNGGTNYSISIAKEGLGTWYLKGSRQFKGSVDVRDGTLQFDTLAETNVASSLGMGTVWTKWCGGLLTPEVLRGHWLELGGRTAEGAAAGEGILEHKGTLPSLSTTRPALLDGHGELLNGGEGYLRYAGLTTRDGAPADNRLVLGGDGAGGELQNVSGQMDVVKRGTGTWALGGSNTFSGTVSVEGGTLLLRDPARYGWYRFTMYATHNTIEKGDSDEWAVPNLVLCDADGVRQNENLQYVSDASPYALAPGSAGYGVSNFRYGSADLTKVTTNATWKTDSMVLQTNNARVATSLANPIPFPVVYRLRDDAVAVTSYDFLISSQRENFRNYSVVMWSLEGSPDGLTWDKLDPADGSEVCFDETLGADTWNADWRFAGTYVPAPSSGDKRTIFNPHTGGRTIASRRTKGVVEAFENVTSVKVATGATLASEPGSQIVLKGLAIDMAGAGTIKNLSFAETGTLKVTGYSQKQRETRLPGTYENVGGLSNLAQWTLNVNDSPAPNMTLCVRGNELYLCRPGLVLIVR